MYSDLDKAKAVLLEIVRQSPGDKIEGKVRVYKAFYFAHLYFARKTNRLLTEWPIVRMPHGPGVGSFEKLMRPLVDQGLVREKSIDIGPFPSVEYGLTRAGRDQPTLSESEVEAISEAVSFVAGQSAARLSELTHEMSRTWNTHKDGEELPIYLDIAKDTFADGTEAAVTTASDDLARFW